MSDEQIKEGTYKLVNPIKNPCRDKRYSGWRGEEFIPPQRIQVRVSLGLVSERSVEIYVSSKLSRINCRALSHDGGKSFADSSSKLSLAILAGMVSDDSVEGKIEFAKEKYYVSADEILIQLASAGLIGSNDIDYAVKKQVEEDNENE